MTLRRLCCCNLTFMALASVALAKEPPKLPDGLTFETTRIGNENLVRHTAKYEPHQFRWALNERLQDVLAVFPHPLVASRIFVATEAGLLVSDDTGQSFAALPAAASDKIGTVNAIAFRPDSAERFLLATQAHGVWSTTDGGKTLTQLATKAAGLASDSVTNVYYSPEDKFRRTILAIHGAESAGLSRSSDGGKTWTTLFPEQHVHRLYWPSREGKEVLLEASPATDVDLHTLYFLASINEPWQKLLDDVFITGAAVPQRFRGDTIFFTTAAKGIFRIARDGGVIRNVEPAGEMEWSSIDATWGATADEQVFFAYHPKKLGMVLFTLDELVGNAQVPADAAANPDAPPSTPYTTASAGLFVGPLVLEGSHIRAAAGGSAFFAVVNRTLYQSVATPAGLSVSNVKVTPSALRIEQLKIKTAGEALGQELAEFNTTHDIAGTAASMQKAFDEQLDVLGGQRISVTATVAGPPTDPVTSVTVDLSRLGRSSASVLLDDGQHGDGAAGDGVYGNTFTLDFKSIRRLPDDWRQTWPGPIPLTVSAVSRSKTVAGAVGVISPFMPQDSIRFAAVSKPGKISGNVVGNLLRVGKTREIVNQVSIKAPGDFAVSLNNGRETVDISGQQVLSFYIRSSQPAEINLSLQLRDGPSYSRPVFTPKVDLTAEDFIKGGKLSPTEQRVLIPVGRLLKDAVDFQPTITQALLLSGKAAQPVDVMIRDIRFLPFAEADESEETQP